MAETSRSYLVRDAGPSSRPGKVFKTYPYTLRALEEALDDAYYRSIAGGAQLVIRVEGRRRTVIRRYENGRQVPVAAPPSS